ncbi:MAG: hemolysin family protein [Nanoarchaeota archaeon]
MLTKIITLVILLALSAFFSAAETAFFSLGKLRLLYLVEKKKKGADFVKRLKDHPQKLITTILVGNNIANIGASAVATLLALEIFMIYNLPFKNPVAITTGILTLIVLIFCEITPKSLAIRHAETLSFIAARPLYYLSLILSPIIKPLYAITGWITNLSGKVERPPITEKELVALVSIGERSGQITEIEGQLIQNVFKFDEITVNQIMTPRRAIFYIDGEKTLQDILPELLQHSFSRVPVFIKTRDNIVGILYMKNIISHVLRKELNVKVKDVVEKPYFIPESKKIDSLLTYFKNKKNHIAIVVDEHGSVSGIVTIEDVLEEIVGEIYDETDETSPDTRKVKKNEWIFKGSIDVNDVNKALKIRLQKRKNFETLGGYILDKIERIPQKGEKLKIGKATFVIEDVDSYRIKEVRVIK